MANATLVRFFTLAIVSCEDGDKEDTVEITRGQFETLVQHIDSDWDRLEYERHTMFMNGANQTCLTFISDNCQYVEDLETV